MKLRNKLGVVVGFLVLWGIIRDFGKIIKSVKNKIMGVKKSFGELWRSRKKVSEVSNNKGYKKFVRKEDDKEVKEIFKESREVSEEEGFKRGMLGEYGDKLWELVSRQDEGDGKDKVMISTYSRKVMSGERVTTLVMVLVYHYSGDKIIDAKVSLLGLGGVKSL